MLLKCSCVSESLGDLAKMHIQSPQVLDGAPGPAFSKWLPGDADAMGKRTTWKLFCIVIFL